VVLPLQIYSEAIYDLLSLERDKKSLKISANDQIKGAVVAGTACLGPD
jgi:hypothetical protein